MGRGHQHHNNNHNRGASYKQNFDRSRHHRNDSSNMRQTNRINNLYNNAEDDNNNPIFVLGHQQNAPLFNNNMQQQYNPNFIYNQQQTQFVSVNNPTVYDPNIYHRNVINIQHQTTCDSTLNWFNSSSSLQDISANALSKQLQFAPNQITETGIIPTSPFYELPAGLMLPLIKPSQKDYKPLDPSDLRLPLPKFPDENFLKSIEMYYGDDGKIRDNDGWTREYIDMIRNSKNSLLN